MSCMFSLDEVLQHIISFPWWKWSLPKSPWETHFSSSCNWFFNKTSWIFPSVGSSSTYNKVLLANLVTMAKCSRIRTVIHVPLWTLSINGTWPPKPRDHRLLGLEKPPFKHTWHQVKYVWGHVLPKALLLRPCNPKGNEGKGKISVQVGRYLWKD